MTIRSLIFWLHLIGRRRCRHRGAGDVGHRRPADLREADGGLGRAVAAGRAAVARRRRGCRSRRLIAKVREARPSATPATLTFRANRDEPVTVALGRDGQVLLNAYTGQVLGEGAVGLRAFFRSVTDWHRWLAATGEYRTTGRAVTGACNLAFLVLVVTGAYLWLPEGLDAPAAAQHHLVPPRPARARRATSTGTTRSASGRSCRCLSSCSRRR